MPLDAAVLQPPPRPHRRGHPRARPKATSRGAVLLHPANGEHASSYTGLSRRWTRCRARRASTPAAGVARGDRSDALRLDAHRHAVLAQYAIMYVSMVDADG